jgi:hypothetical protein
MAGCTKHAQVPVVYFSDRWDLGEVKDCEQVQSAKEHDSPGAIPSKDMICSIGDYDSELMALTSQNSPEAIRLRHLFADPEVFAVTFKGSGIQFKGSTSWKCRRTVDGLLCE